MYSQENTRIIQESYVLFGKGDIPNLFQLYADDVQFIFPGPTDNPLPGTYRGKEQVLKFLSNVNEHIQFEAFEPREFISQGDKVAVVGYERGVIRATGQTYELDWVQLFTLREGKIISLQAFLDPSTIVAAFKHRAMQEI